MPTIHEFDQHLTSFDLPVLFKGRLELKSLLEKADQVFGRYAHLIEDQEETWVAECWATGAYYGYRLANPGDPNASTAIDLGRGVGDRLQSAPIGVSDATYRYLYSNRSSDRKHWSISTRSGTGTYSVIRAGQPPGTLITPELIQAQLDAALSAIGSYAAPASAQNFFEQLCSSRQWDCNAKDITSLFHLVWPQLFPVWYTQETATGYCQLHGLQKLLDSVSNETGLVRQGIDLQGQYQHYAAAYRLLLRLYHQFVDSPGKARRRTPHFDYFTDFLGGLEANREALQMLLNKKALVLYGVPGTGKTHAARNELAPAIAEHIKTVQFHPGYSYADFVIGIRPRASGQGVTYPVEPGFLYRFAAEAALALQANPQQPFGDGMPARGEESEESEGSVSEAAAEAAEPACDALKPLRYVLVIDEINRADLAKVLGEVMLQLEYRGACHPVALPMQLAAGSEIKSVIDEQPLADPFAAGAKFYLPENLYIIGTMNHADRSISGFDMALRRRFAWARHGFRASELREIIKHKCEDAPGLALANLEEYVLRCQQLNRCIAQGRIGAARLPLTPDHMVGHTYFAEVVSIVRQSGHRSRITSAHLETLWLYYLAPLLEDFLGFEMHQFHSQVEALRSMFIAQLTP